MGKSEQPDSVTFYINGEKHTVGKDAKNGAKTALADYIRDVANLKGTKVSCREGGCGACVVKSSVIDPNTGAEIVKSVNSCLTPVLSCNGWDISTVEHLGNKHEGYHVVQNRLVNFHGTQCGFCTPGMIMNMYSLLEGNGNLEMKDIEQNLDGNLCRCTGYRPILDAFKSLTKDCSEEIQRKCADIEDCVTCPLKKQSGNTCSGKASKALPASSVSVKLSSGEEWVSAKTLDEALAEAEAATGNDVEGVRFVAGNTSTGIFKNEGPYRKFVDINGIPELRRAKVDDNGITIGGGVTLTELIKLLKENAHKPGLEYGQRMAQHLERVANVSVRNNGTVAGNLMIKHKYREFPSDVFVLLETLGASLVVVSGNGGQGKSILPREFLETSMNRKLVLSIHLPRLEGYLFRSFKITRRYQNAHAYVNAGLLFKVENAGGKFVVGEKPRLVFGGISGQFIHASATEEILAGKSLADPATLAGALKALEKEVKPEEGPLEAAPEYRIRLVKSLLYKTILEIVGSKVAKKLGSGSVDLVRTLTKAKQTFDTDASDVALYKAVPKYEAGIQASGEAEYVGDIPHRKDELFGVFVTSTVAVADIEEMDASEALKIPGVVRFVTAKDIPGVNNYQEFNFFPSIAPDPVFAPGKVGHYGQPVGLILATSQHLATQAAKLVRVKYSNETPPIVNIDKAIEKAKTEGKFAAQTGGTFTTKPLDNIKVKHSVKGEYRAGSQYHFYMETQSVVCHPREDGVDLYCTSQWMNHVQNNVALVLNIPTNGVNVQVRRLGGGFGGKASRHTYVACACAVATWVTNKPVRIILDLEANMNIVGKRLPYRIPYEVGFDDNGRIGSLNADIICDTGFVPSESTSFVAVLHLQNLYKAAGWTVASHFVTTNTPANTFCRAPGSIHSTAAIEWIMDHVANYLKVDPLKVREANLIETGDAILLGPPIYTRENFMPGMITQMKEETGYEQRRIEIERFNEENRWKKRGISVVPVRYMIDYFATNLPASVAIYHMDGHVAVTHGGIEMGQGLNTKVIQTVAQALNIPMSRIKVKPSNNFVAANGTLTAGSLGSELACYSVLNACEQIRANLQPILEKLENPKWEELIAEAYKAKVDLTASYTPTAEDEIKGYDVWVLNVVEVEVDVLTGEYKVLKTDLYEDTGKSLSPAVDLGQIEGGYIMGQGYWTTEKIVHDEATGKLLTNGTWTYKVPECKDIPEDFRITLLSKVPNPHGVLRSKATGEPSVDAAYAVVLAMRQAIASARKDAGNEEWFEMDVPVTPEDIAKLCLVQDSHLTL